MLTKNQLQQMSDSQLKGYVLDYGRQNKLTDLEAADMYKRLNDIRQATPTAPSTGVTKGRNKPRRMGKTQGYKYGGKACSPRGRKAIYKA